MVAASWCPHYMAGFGSDISLPVAVGSGRSSKEDKNFLIQFNNSKNIKALFHTLNNALDAEVKKYMRHNFMSQNVQLGRRRLVSHYKVNK